MGGIMICKDRVALVTGGSAGIGRSIALTLAREGASVIVNYRQNRDNAQAVADHIRLNGGQAVAIQADVQTEEGCRFLVEESERAFGRIDICIISPGGGFNPQPLDRLDAADAILEVTKEVTPAFWLLRLVLPGMYERRWGRILGMSQHPTQYHQPAVAHNAAKSARAGLLLLAAEGDTWKNGVTVNALAPGPVSTCQTLSDAVEQCGHGQAWAARTTTSGQDIAEAAAYLCSEAGRFITGGVLPFSFRF
jgi:3-oxoacyl-[acyl-carrier protein] reductase